MAIPILSRYTLCNEQRQILRFEKLQIGAIFRSATALDIDAVLTNSSCCDPLYRRAVRVSMGTPFRVLLTRIGSKCMGWTQPCIE